MPRAEFVPSPDDSAHAVRNQDFDDENCDVEDSGSKLFHKHLKASKDGIVRVACATDTCEIVLHESGATIRDSKRGTTMFGMFHDHGLVVSLLQFEDCKLERDG